MKKFLTLCLIATVLAFFPRTASAQYTNKKDSTTVIIFNDPSSQTYHKRGENNIVKIAPLGFLNGTFPLLYERRINDFLSVQVSGGLTHRSYVRELLLSDNYDYINYPWSPGSGYTDIADPLYNFGSRTAKPGFCFSAQPRVYFDNDGLDGSFMGMSLDYYRYNFAIPALVSNNGNISADGPEQKEHENIKDFMAHFGYQTLYDHITLEYTTGLGLRNISGEKYVAWQTSDGDVFSGFATYKKNTITFSIGLKVGYHF